MFWLKGIGMLLVGICVVVSGAAVWAAVSFLSFIGSIAIAAIAGLTLAIYGIKDYLEYRKQQRERYTRIRPRDRQ